MERLTIQTEKGAALKRTDNYTAEALARQDLIVRYRAAVACLAAYENTGLEPEEIKELCSDDVAEVAKMFRRMIENGSIDHLEELLQAEKDGRLVVLPPNDPLTIEELREMDGEPVWITPGGFWALVIARRGERVRLINHESEIVWADKEIELVGPVYRRKPEKGEEHGKQS